MKTCRDCKNVYPHHNYHKNKHMKDGVSPNCKQCVLAYRKKRYAEHRPRLLAINRNSRLKTNYGISSVDYDRIYHGQGGACAICTIHQSLLKIPLSVDHNHSTGEVRGLLCGPCNRAIGMFKDNPDNLAAGAVYLRRSSMRMVINEDLKA